MRIRIAKLRVVRFFRVALPLVFFTLVGSLARNYWIQRQLPTTERPSLRQLMRGISAQTEGLEYQHTEGDRTFYTLKAKTEQTFEAKDAPHLFHGVEVTIYGEKPGDPDRRIESDEAAYDKQTGDVEFRGNVTGHLDEKTRVRTAVLNYRNHARLALSPTRTTLDQPGGMTAVADRMEFGLDSGVLKLNGHVHAALAGGTELDAKAAVFNRKESWVTASEDVSMRSPNGWARGGNARAELDPDTFQPKTVTLRGSVTAETRSAKTSDIWKLAQADRLDLALAAKGAIERAAAFGKARIEKISTDGRGQTLTGGEIVSLMNASGNVDSVEATGTARLEAGQNDRHTRLDANKIRIDPAGTIVTEGPSRLDASGSVITGSNFKIEQGDVATFTTFFPASVESPSPASGTAAGSGIRHMQARHSTIARFDSKTNRLVRLDSTGSVQFTDGERSGHADQAIATEGGDNLTLIGSATVNIPKTQIDARQIDILQRGSAFKASGAVTTRTESQSGPVTVTSNEAHGASGPNSSQTVFYSGNVKTSVRTDSGPLRITANTANGDAATMTFVGSVDSVLESDQSAKSDKSAGGVVHIVAAHATGNADKMTYTSAVQLWRDNVYIASESLEVFPKDKRFTAQGNVASRMDAMTGASPRLEYDDARQTVRYSGGAVLRKTDMKIEGAVVNAQIMEGRVSTATAEGAVTVTQGVRRGTGDRAVYDAKMDRVTLTGRPARLNDPEHGNSEGATATMEMTAKKATITGAGDGSPAGRVTSTTKISR